MNTELIVEKITAMRLEPDKEYIFHCPGITRFDADDLMSHIKDAFPGLKVMVVGLKKLDVYEVVAVKK